MITINIEKDFQRQVVCLLGIPFDIVRLSDVIEKINESSLTSNRCIISTPNVNFVISARKDNVFLSSIINSDLNIIDGMPLVWLSKLLAFPVKERVAGSDLLDALAQKEDNHVTKVFFFGGEEGIAEKAAHIVNSNKLGIHVNGFFDPGFTSVENMSTPGIIKKINSSDADFLILALGAVKGQTWIEHNKSLLKVPVVSHLGAALNFITGNIKRSPVFFQKTGLEWLWRIYQEPVLWKRYFQDGKEFLGLLFFRVLPYYFWLKRTANQQSDDFFEYSLDDINTSNKSLVLSYKGTMSVKHIDVISDSLYQSYQYKTAVDIDFSNVKYIDSFAIGKLFILKKHLDVNKLSLRIVNLSDKLKKVFYWNCAESLLDKK